MGKKAKETTKTARKSRHVRRQIKALRHAAQRTPPATGYVLARITRHIDAIKAGKVPEVHPDRPGCRKASQEAQARAAAMRRVQTMGPAAMRAEAAQEDAGPFQLRSVAGTM